MMKCHKCHDGVYNYLALKVAFRKLSPKWNALNKFAYLISSKSTEIHKSENMNIMIDQKLDTALCTLRSLPMKLSPWSEAKSDIE